MPAEPTYKIISSASVVARGSNAGVQNARCRVLRYKFTEAPHDAKGVGGQEKRASQEEPAGTPAEKRACLESPVAQPKENAAPNDVQRVAQLHRSNEVRLQPSGPFTCPGARRQLLLAWRRLSSQEQKHFTCRIAVVKTGKGPRQAVRDDRGCVLQELRKQLGDARAHGDALQGELDAAAKQRNEALKAVEDLMEQVRVLTTAVSPQRQLRLVMFAKTTALLALLACDRQSLTKQLFFNRSTPLCLRL